MFRSSRRAQLIFATVGLSFAALSWTSRSRAEGLREGGGRRLEVGGIVAGPHVEDVLGVGQNHFQGLIAAELSGAGYRLNGDSAGSRPLTLWGTIKEEVCDGAPPRQCRIGIQWELQGARSEVLYRTTTRAVAEGKDFERERRELVLGALHSLMQRRRFALQVEPFKAPSDSVVAEPLGFKQCRRTDLRLPQAARSAAAAIVLVISGSNLQRGTIVSPDGLILTSSDSLVDGAPLNVRLVGGQRLPARIVALSREAHAALLRTQAHTDNACLSLSGEAPAAGSSVFGVSSELSDDAGTSLTRSLILDVQSSNRRRVVVDARVAQGAGSPLLDDEGRLAGVVEGPDSATPGRAMASPVAEVLEALRIKPAAVTDARLLDLDSSADGAYVREEDDPPFVLDKRYTYGSAKPARTLRTAGLVTSAVGAAVVVYTWASYRGAKNPSPAKRDRFVIENDVGWVLVGLGAAGVGASFVWPEAHEVVAVHGETASRRRFSIGLGALGLTFSSAL